VVEKYPLIILYFLSLALTVYLFKSEIRFRLPIDFVILGTGFYYLKQKMNKPKVFYLLIVFFICTPLLRLNLFNQTRASINQFEKIELLDLLKKAHGKLVLLSGKFGVDFTRVDPEYLKQIKHYTGHSFESFLPYEGFIGVSIAKKELIIKRSWKNELSFNSDYLKQIKGFERIPDFKIHTKPYVAGFKSEIIVDGVNLAGNVKGLSVVVLDPVTHHLLYSGSFNFYKGTTGYVLKYSN
jgi:hypothetical protein